MDLDSNIFSKRKSSIDAIVRGKLCVLCCGVVVWAPFRVVSASECGPKACVVSASVALKMVSE